jgi:hypothetical protein
MNTWETSRSSRFDGWGLVSALLVPQGTDEWPTLTGNRMDPYRARTDLMAVPYVSENAICGIESSGGVGNYSPWP